VPKLQILSNSKRGCYLSCEAKYYWQFVRRLRPKVTPRSLWLGSLIHEALAEFYLKIKAHQDGGATKQWAYKEARYAALAKFADKYDEEMQYLLTLPDNQFNEEAQEQAEKDFHLGVSMLNQYHAFAFEQDDFRIVAIEEEVKYRLPGTNILLVAHIDLLGETAGGTVVIREHKTAASLYDNYIDLHLDTQPTVYALMLRRLLDIKIPRVEYNFLKKVSLSEPRVLKNNKLSVAKNQLTTPKLYRAAIEKQGLQEADYADFIEYLEDNPIKTNHIELVTRSFEEIEHDIESLKTVAKLMRDVEKREPVMTPSHWCRTCSYNSLCKIKVAGGGVEEVIDALFKEADYLPEEVKNGR